MKYFFKKLSPYFLILLGLFVLFIVGKAEVAGVCLLIGIVMVFESIWPEEWETEKRKKGKLNRYNMLDSDNFPKGLDV